MRSLYAGLSGVLLVGLFCGGCGSGGSAGRFDISGTVSFDGKPVPVGQINFEPDASRGNHGPGAVAEIKEGRYRTARGKGPTGGAHVVRITGYDGVPCTLDGKPDGMYLPEGKSLFPPYVAKVDLPKESSKQDFQVPAAAAAK